MHALLAWIQANPTLFTVVAWPAITAIVTAIFKPRTAAEYDKLPHWAASILRIVGALGIDVPALLKGIRMLVMGPQKIPVVNEEETPTNPGARRRNLITPIAEEAVSQQIPVVEEVKKEEEPKK
jgi:hypothetical protein